MGTGCLGSLAKYPLGLPNDEASKAFDEGLALEFPSKVPLWLFSADYLRIMVPGHCLWGQGAVQAVRLLLSLSFFL